MFFVNLQGQNNPQMYLILQQAYQKSAFNTKILIDNNLEYITTEEVHGWGDFLYSNRFVPNIVFVLCWAMVVKLFKKLIY